MRSFKKIQEMLRTQPDIKKIYLIGCTGAGKTSLVQHILDSKKHDFPVTTHRRTTIAPTEYIVQKNIPFKTTIILKEKEDVVSSIRELIESAIVKAKSDNSDITDVVFELEQSPDERFKLNQMVEKESFESVATSIINEIIPSISNIDINDETLLSGDSVSKSIDNLVNKLSTEIEIGFNKAFDGSKKLFTNPTVTIEGIPNKDDFIKANKKLLSHEFGSISILAEYVRIEGDLIAGWLDSNLEFMLIDGEGIGHTLVEKADTLSARHYDYFNYCNNIVLVDDASNPFSGGGKGAIEGIFLNGYENKFKLVFSKLDKLEHTDQNSYFRRNINNLKNALTKDGISFLYENKDSYKLSNLNGKIINDDSKKSIKSLLASIDDVQVTDLVDLEYDFNLLFQSFNSDDLINTIKKRVEGEHWAVVKAFSRRLNNKEFEYRHLKPISWILLFVMQEINTFLKKDDFSSVVLDSQNIIKQKFSNNIIYFIYENLIFNKQHLWQQAYEKAGRGSHKQRKDFIFEKIITDFLPPRSHSDEFEAFRNDIKNLLIKSGAKELKKAKQTIIKHVSIKKIFDRNIEWSLGYDTNVLIGRNGCGKSTILKLIHACILNDKKVLEDYGSPYVELTVLKKFDNGETQESKISHSKSVPNLHVAMVNTFDIKSDKYENDLIDLDSQLLGLSNEFGVYQRSLTQRINKELGMQIERRDDLFKNISESSPDDLVVLQKLSVDIDRVKKNINEPIIRFKAVLDNYLSETNKTLVLDNEDSPLLIKSNNKQIKVTDLSSGEKQLLIIFLTVLLQRDQAFIMLMDEPETSLHVEWQVTFIDEIKRLNSNVQIIVATHNPLILLNRESDEVGIIEADFEHVQKRDQGTTYLDVSTILIDYFGLTSLVGKKMQDDIKRFNVLKLKDSRISSVEKEELESIESILATSLAGDVIYDKNYFQFLKFMKNNKNLDFQDYQQSSDEEMAEFLSEFSLSFQSVDKND